MLKICLFSLFIAGLPEVALAEATPDNYPSEFRSMLLKELANRSTARYAIDSIRNQDLSPEVAHFWDSYRRLETMSEDRYSPVAAELTLVPGAFVPWAKGRSAALVYRFAPQKFLDTMAKGTQEYYRELQKNSNYVPNNYRDLYGYVLSQEEVQVNALSDAAKGDFTAASARLVRFIDDYTNASE